MSFKAKLKAAKELYVQHRYQEALERCTSALQDNEESPDGLLLQGKLLFEVKDYQASGKAYSAILRSQPNLLPAWKGLAELYTTTKNDAESVGVYESLLRLGASESKERRQEYQLKLASAQQRLGQASQAVHHFEQLLHGPLALTEPLQRLHVECQLADLHMSDTPTGEDLKSLQESLASIVSQTSADASHAAYHAKHLQLLLHNLEQQTARSSERSEQATACCDAVQRMVQCKPGGCCTAVPFQAALLFAEDQDLSVDLSQAGPLLHIGRPMCHQFPWLPDSGAALGLALYAQLITTRPGPTKTKDRTLIVQVLSRAMRAGADSLQGWQLLCQLQLQNEQYDLAAESAAMGLKCLHQRRSRGYRSQPAVAAAIVLTRGYSLLAGGRPDEALVLFTALTDEESSSPVKQLLEPATPALKQDAMRGQALVLKQQGNTEAAEQMLSDLVHSKEQFAEVQHLAQAGFGALLMDQGKPEEAKAWLERAVTSASLEGACATDKQVAKLRLHLGCVCWALGVTSEEARGEAQAHWLAAAAVAGSHQAAAFAKLGMWYADFKADKARARKCFQRGLGLDPLQADAGEGLCNLLKNEGRADTAQALCQEVSTRAPGATWAWRRLGFFALDASDSEKAVLCFQTALRGDVRHVGAWEGLGSAYQSLARLTAALKAYGRAIELQPGRLYSLVQSGLVFLALGNYTEAQQVLQTALQADSNHVPALFAAAQLLLASAKYRIVQGTPGMAGEDLAEAGRHCQKCSEHSGNLQAVWKLMGDVHLQFHATTPPHQAFGPHRGPQNAPGSPSDPKAATAGRGALQDTLDSWQLRIEAMQTARRAYMKALHLAPQQGSSWGDLGATFYHEAQLRRAHPRLDPSQAKPLRAAAEKLMRGGVRLDPSSAPLWAGLGSCATCPKHQEYAFTRSLQLDPKSAHTWAALGRLYMECGARHLADTCFTQARSQEPADPATWAAMGALAGLSPTGANDKADFYEHAVKLGAGPEALAGFAEGAVEAGRAGSGGVYAATRKIVEAQPYNAAAYNVLGLACEARGDFSGAVKAYANGVDVRTDSESGPAAKDRIAGPLSLVQQDCDSTKGVQQALDLNLVRALMLMSCSREAVERFGRLEASGVLQQQPAAWLSYGLALQQTKGTPAQAQALHALDQGLSASPGPQEHALLLHAWVKVQLADSSRQLDLSQLLSHVRQLQAAKPEVAILKPIWLSLSAAAAAATDGTGAALEKLIKLWRAQADDDSAEFNAELMRLSALHSYEQGHTLQAARQAARALHTCPWTAPQQALAARTFIDASPTYSPPALCISRGFNLMDLCQATQSYKGPPAHLADEDTVLDMVAVRVTGTTAQPCCLATAQQAKDTYQAVLQWAHCLPHTASIWYLAATAAVHHAACSQQAGSYHAALTLCKRAQHLLSSSSRPQQQHGTAQANGHGHNQDQQQQSQQQHMHMQVKLQCMMSECHLHGRKRDGSGQALSAAKAAVQTASGFQEPQLVAVALRQLSRCLAATQRHREAEMACRKAIAAHPSSPAAAMQLAAVLQRTGKDEDAVDAIKHAQGQLSSLDEASRQRWQVTLHLQEAQHLAAMGDLAGACSICQQALDLSISAGLHVQSHTNTAQVLFGSLSLQLAEAEPDSPQTSGTLAAAHRVLSQALACQGQTSRQDDAVICMLLARVELLGNLRRKQERAQAHAMKALQMWPKPAPGSLCALAARLQPEGLTLSCKAVHTEPWQTAHRELMAMLAA